MDPYLEGYLWPDVHQALAGEIRRRLVPKLIPRYVARLKVHVVEDENPEAEIGILYPDVKVLGPIEVHLTSVEVRDAARNELVTTIGVLSPVNKREPGLKKYREKRQRLHRAGVHLLEIDLLRRATRPLAPHPRLPSAAYVVSLTRGRAQAIDVWPLGLRDRLPVVPVPLRDPDPDVPLELGSCLGAVYDEARYELSIDYAAEPPPPPLDTADAEWARRVAGGRTGGSEG
jgi:hypothetical protein